MHVKIENPRIWNILENSLVILTRTCVTIINIRKVRWKKKNSASFDEHRRENVESNEFYQFFSFLFFFSITLRDKCNTIIIFHFQIHVDRD